MAHLFLCLYSSAVFRRMSTVHENSKSTARENPETFGPARSACGARVANTQRAGPQCAGACRCREILYTGTSDKHVRICATYNTGP